MTGRSGLNVTTGGQYDQKIPAGDPESDRARSPT
jgi:hypothetical protein